MSARTVGLVFGTGVALGTKVGDDMTIVGFAICVVGGVTTIVGVAVSNGSFPCGTGGFRDGVGVGFRLISTCLRVRRRGPFGNPVVICQPETGDDKALSKAPVSALDLSKDAVRVPMEKMKVYC